jgi:2-polyprenyl-6-methoxyphenol hydroxylase-like FAD-dependent oxidoreductase
VGAGPAGLALAIELGHRDIPCLVVERNDRVGYAPRAKTTHVRTREHMRRWGITQDLVAASPLGVDYPSDVHFVTRLNGFPIAKFENAFNCAPQKNPLYAEHAQWIPQYTLEEVMRKHAQSLPGVEIRFNRKHLSFEPAAGKVVSRLGDTSADREFVIETDYLVGADGSRSRIRDAIGATMHGERDLSRNYNIIFRAPGLAEAHPHGPGVMYWQVNEDMPSLLGPMDGDDRWFFMPTRLAPDATFTDEQAVSAIRQATGIDLPYEILSSDEWVANSLIADKYRKGNVFLTGDAAHLHPPFGGFGMFLGVLDSIDLGWKMAAVLKGQGGPVLLDSYEIERKSVHEYVVDQAVKNHAVLTEQFVMHGIEDPGTAGDQLRVEVGYWFYS